MSGDRNINMGGGTYNERNINIGGGTYNEAIYGDSINIQGNFININQDLSQTAVQIRDKLVDFEKQGYTPEEAQIKVANELKTQWDKPGFRHHLKQLGRYVRTEAANGVIGEIAVIGIKAVLGLIGIPLP
jgi:hypothetical protein